MGADERCWFRHPREDLTVVTQRLVARVDQVSEAFVDGGAEFGAQPVEGLAQGLSPRQRKARFLAGHAPAVTAPPLDAVRATPRRHLGEFDLVGRLVRSQPLTDGGLDTVVARETPHREREADVGEVMVVAVGLAVGDDQDDAILPVKFVDHGVGEQAPVLGQIAEGHPVGEIAVTEDDGDGSTVLEAHEIGERRVEGVLIDALPRCVIGAHAHGLGGHQDRVANPLIDEGRQRREVDRRFG